MEYRMKIGKKTFCVHSPYSVRWKTEDEQFLTEEKEDGIPVWIEAVEHLPLISEKKIYEMDSMSIYANGECEVREYRAMFLPGHPLYAQSRWDGRELKIYYQKSSGAWNHGNMSIWNFLHLENQLLDSEGIALHCCYTEYHGEAILFSAPSGTGKTTQAELWKKCYHARIINGDKCLLQKNEGIWEAWGYPLHGSAKECENKKLPIRCIVVLRQSLENRVELLTDSKKVRLLYSESTVNPWNMECIGQALDLLKDTAEHVPVIMLHCNMQDDAAKVLHTYLYGSDTDGII